MSRSRPIMVLAALNFAAAAVIVLFLTTDFTKVVPIQLDILFGSLALVHCVLGWGLLKLWNWARLGTVFLASFWALPSVIEILSAFQSLNVVKLLVHLCLVTVDGMIIGYLVHPAGRRVFEAPPVELHLK